MVSTLQSYHQDLHSNQMDRSNNYLVCTSVNNDLAKTHPSFIGFNALTSNVSAQASFTNEHSTTRMNYPHTTPTSSFVGCNPPALDMLPHINRMKDERTEKLSYCMPDVKIEKKFLLIVCN